MYHKNILNIYALCHLSYNYKLIGKTDLEGCQTQQKSVNKNSYNYWFVLLVVIITVIKYITWRIVILWDYFYVSLVYK